MSDRNCLVSTKIWVCRVCGKTATDRYGIEGSRSYGWDESCMLNSGLYDITNLVMEGDRVVQFRQPESATPASDTKAEDSARLSVESSVASRAADGLEID